MGDQAVLGAPVRAERQQAIDTGFEICAGATAQTKAEGARNDRTPSHSLSADYFWMQVSTVSLVHSSRPVKTGSATFLPSIRAIIVLGAR